MQHFLHMLTMWISLQKVGLFIFEVLSTFSTRNPYPHLPLSLPTERREFSSHIINKKSLWDTDFEREDHMDAINSCCCWRWWRSGLLIILMLFDVTKLRMIVWGLFTGVCSITFWCHCYSNGTKANLICSRMEFYNCERSCQIYKSLAVFEMSRKVEKNSP